MRFVERESITAHRTSRRIKEVAEPAKRRFHEQ